MTSKLTITWAVAQTLLAVCGCGTTYTFDIERVAVDGTIDSPTTVDLVAIELDDLQRDSSLKRMTAAEWFAYQYEHGHPIVDGDRVESILGLPDDAVVRVKLVHPDPVAWSAAIYLFAEVPEAADALIPRHTYRITQLPPRGGEYTVKLEGDRMTVTRGPYRGPKTTTRGNSD